MWLRDVDDVEERNKRIEALGADDFFRNVFRTNVSAPTTPVETLKWGIDYIDGLRKAEADSREQRLKKWSSLILPFSSLAVAAITVALGFYNQRELNRTQVQLKQYEVTARPKQEGYVRMMRAVGNAIDQSRSSNRADAARALVEWESGYYSVAPFLTNEDRGKLWNWFQKFKGRLASPATTAPSQGWSGDDPLTSLHREFGEDLFEALFMHDAL
jgi:hypothetical protein